MEGGQGVHGAQLPFFKLWIIFWGTQPPLKNLSLSHLLLCDQTITIKGANSVMIIFSQFVVYQLISSLTKFVSSVYQ